MDPAKVEAILKLPNPKSKKDVRSFLGYAGYLMTRLKTTTKRTRLETKFHISTDALDTIVGGVLGQKEES